MPSGKIGSYEYYTLNDLEYMVYTARMKTDSWKQIKENLLDIAQLAQKYAMQLADYESRYLDDGR